MAVGAGRPSGVDDRVAVEAFLARRDEDSFLTLYDRHTPALYLFALRTLGGVEQDAEDVVQEAWLRAVDRLQAFRWGSSLRTWLTGIVLNCAREALRRRRPAPLASFRDAPPPAGLPAAAVLPAPARPASADDAQASTKDDAARVGTAIDLERALCRIPDDLRLTLLLHDVEGYTHAEIAELLGIRPGTSKSRTARAREHLRTLLGADSPRVAAIVPESRLEEAT